MPTTQVIVVPVAPSALLPPVSVSTTLLPAALPPTSLIHAARQLQASIIWDVEMEDVSMRIDVDEVEDEDIEMGEGTLKWRIPTASITATTTTTMNAPILFNFTFPSKVNVVWPPAAPSVSGVGPRSATCSQHRPSPPGFSPSAGSLAGAARRIQQAKKEDIEMEDRTMDMDLDDEDEDEDVDMGEGVECMEVDDF
ncbi:hypothetical protein BGX29_002846 [Mortierella sp. GBA35]|nr:hypothetical protein BGX29_002846 [Mortierella sp. GBA35]